MPKKSPIIKYATFDLSEVLLTRLEDTGIALREKHKMEIVSAKIGL